MHLLADNSILMVQSCLEEKAMKTFLVLIGLLAIIASAFFFYQAYDKYMNYYNSEVFTSLQKNAYVGGDAYNYIINGTYFTGFSVLGVGSLLLGMLCIGIAYISSKMEESRVELQSIFKKIGEAKTEAIEKVEDPS